MLDNQYTREIKQRMDTITRDAIIEERKQNIHERPRGMHAVTANGPAQAFQNLHYFKPRPSVKGKGINEYEEIEDARRVEIENALGAGKKACVETKYKKQMPVLGGSNMEMVPDEREQIMKGAGHSIPANTFSRLVISELKDQKGAGWADAIKEITTSSSAPSPAASSSSSSSVVGAGVSKRTARADKIKEIMKEKGMKMTEASSYIKKNNIPY